MRIETKINEIIDDLDITDPDPIAMRKLYTYIFELTQIYFKERIGDLSEADEEDLITNIVNTSILKIMRGEEIWSWNRYLVTLVYAKSSSFFRKLYSSESFVEQTDLLLDSILARELSSDLRSNQLIGPEYLTDIEMRIRTCGKEIKSLFNRYMNFKYEALLGVAVMRSLTDQAELERISQLPVRGKALAISLLASEIFGQRFGRDALTEIGL